MLTISIATWIANAAACLTGLYGDVTHQADAADCSRQTVYDQAQKVRAAVEAEHSGGPTRAELIQENSDLRQENARLWEWLAQTVEFPPDKRHEFTVTATAMGLSLNQILVLLALILGARARPGRTTLHRGIKAAGIAAGRVLKHLDARGQALVLVGCLEEIFFHRRPVLVGVEPTSMVWFLGQKANARTGSTWSRALQDFPALSDVLADAGTGLQAGIAAVQQQRQQDGQRPLENGLDVLCSTPPRRRDASCVRSGAAWNGSGNRPKRPIAGSRRRSNRATMRGARRSRRAAPGRRRRRRSGSTNDRKRVGRLPARHCKCFVPRVG